MKRILLIASAVFLSVMVAHVQAAEVTFNPDSVTLTVESGKSATAILQVKADSKGPYMIDLRVGSTTTEGNAF